MIKNYAINNKTDLGNGVDEPELAEQVITYCIVITIAAFAGAVKAIRKYQKESNNMSLKHF